MRAVALSCRVKEYGMMIGRQICSLLGILLLTVSAFGAADGAYDVVVYGGSPSGLAAAVQAARLGSRVVVVLRRADVILGKDPSK